jgi:periplasmic protein TonB
MNEHDRARLSRISDRRRDMLDSYRLHLLAGYTLSMLLIVVLFRLPAGDQLRVGWEIASTPERMELNLLDVERAHDTGSGAPVVVGNDVQIPVDLRDAPVETLERPVEEPPRRDRRLDMRPMTAQLHSEPHVRGGIGNFYMLIEYPAEARDKGIQGRLILDFTVGPDGRPFDIVVSQSLHALCDSAAVRALRRTRFVPGTVNGEAVPVRMRLPVRFELLEFAASMDP